MLERLDDMLDEGEYAEDEVRVGSRCFSCVCVCVSLWFPMCFIVCVLFSFAVYGVQWCTVHACVCLQVDDEEDARYEDAEEDDGHVANGH